MANGFAQYEKPPFNSNQRFTPTWDDNYEPRSLKVVGINNVSVVCGKRYYDFIASCKVESDSRPRLYL